MSTKDLAIAISPQIDGADDTGTSLHHRPIDVEHIMGEMCQ